MKALSHEVWSTQWILNSAKTKQSAAAGLLLAHCLRRWPNIKPTSVQRLGHTVWTLRSLAKRFSVWWCCFLCHAVFLATRVWPCRVYSCSLALHHTRLSVYGARIAWIQPILPVSVLLCDCSRLSPPSGLIQEVCLSRQQPPTQQISTHPLYHRLLESTYLPDWMHLPIYQTGCIYLSTRPNLLLPHLPTQQTQDIDPMLVQCWASVVDGGPTLDQHWVDVLCLLGIYQTKSRAARIYLSSKRTHWNNVGLMLGQRCRRWANVKPTLFQCVLFAGYLPDSISCFLVYM